MVTIIITLDAVIDGSFRVDMILVSILYYSLLSELWTIYNISIVGPQTGRVILAIISGYFMGLILMNIFI